MDGQVKSIIAPTSLDRWRHKNHETCLGDEGAEVWRHITQYQ